MRDDLSFHGSLDPDEWRRWVREWREAGRFEEALRAHEWYHANVLELDEAAYGVRLSYAFLAEDYAPALNSLVRIRDEARPPRLGVRPTQKRSWTLSPSTRLSTTKQPPTTSSFGSRPPTRG
ncbi:MAG: hypothetical protein LC792_11715 [Actinobacteria bacterium]|nr:hypothetical protein [Actinomycetota bacterium]